MATTSIIIEILVIGIFSAVWILLGLVRTGIVNVADLRVLTSTYERFSSLALIISTAGLYQLGWLVNGLCDAVTTPLSAKRLRDKLFKAAKLEYEPVRATVYQLASPDLRGDLGTDRTVTRLSRAAALNFLLIAVVMMTFGGKFIFLGLILLACSIGSAFQWYFRYKRYYKRIISAYKSIREQISE